MEAYIGIDFGTTNIRVALRRLGETPIPLRIGIEELYIPSVVALKREANGPPSIYQVGEPASSLTDSDEILVIENIKRCLTYRIRPYNFADLPYWWDRESMTIRIWGYSIDPMDVASSIVEDALRAATRAAGIYGIDLSGDEVQHLSTTVGCPAYSGYAVHDMVAKIMRRGGVEDIGIGAVVEEPNLTAVAFAALRELRHKDAPELGRPRKVLIYDLGGGTFDTAIVEVRFADGVPQLTVLGADCLPFTGGMDIDQALFSQVLWKVADAVGMEPEELSGTLHDWERQSLLRHVRDVKRQLSIVAEARLAMPDLGGQPVDIPVTREDLRVALDGAGVVDATLQCCLRAYRRARMYLDRDDPGGFHMGVTEDGRLGDSILKLRLKDMVKGVDDVILVGRSTLIPDVREQLLDLFGKEKVVSDESYLHPITANSVGATISRDHYLPRVLTRSPYWIRLSCGETTTDLYRPFDPYLEYDFSMGFGVEKLLHRNVDLSAAESATVVIRHCDDGDEGEDAEPFETDRESDAIFTFDRYGTIHICRPQVAGGDGASANHRCRDVLYPSVTSLGQHEFPWQHEYQRRMLQAHREDERRTKEEEEKKLDRWRKQNPFHEVN